MKKPDPKQTEAERVAYEKGVKSVSPQCDIGAVLTSEAMDNAVLEYAHILSGMRLRMYDPHPSDEQIRKAKVRVAEAVLAQCQPPVRIR